jgi:hypothetical protein
LINHTWQKHLEVLLERKSAIHLGCVSLLCLEANRKAEKKLIQVFKLTIDDECLLILFLSAPTHTAVIQNNFFAYCFSLASIQSTSNFGRTYFFVSIS